ncbi:hypothetical protein [uncultured Corynebacterium sp.]|uniref:hypothetical protein n=1 Tax=uncultured Corynebacterium sp. TaxID=159447 RepID=UPI002593CA3B|nr:hypothetical protein [uncultured Corynebacterium sp.]
MVVALVQHVLRDHRSELLALSNDAGLLKFIAEVDEAAELQASLEDTEALRAQFTEEFAKYAPATPDDEVARLALAEITEQVPTETATELQAISVIQKIIQVAQLAGPATLHAAVIDGTLAQWVRRLETF